MAGAFCRLARLIFGLVLFLLFGIRAVHAQVVADGATATLNNVTTNINGSVTVGTNGAFTLLVLNNAALLTNSGNGVIGLNTGANSNTVRLTSANTRWLMASDLFVGSNGAFNRLIISNSARVENNFGSLTVGPAGSNNEAIVTGTGSFWSNRNDLYVGYLGNGNRLVVTNGGLVVNHSGALGFDGASDGNQAVVTGPNSIWTNQASMFVGFAGSGNRLTVTNNGALLASNNVLIGDLSGSVSNSVLVVAGGVVTNGRGGIVGLSPGANGNSALVSDPGSRWVNGGDFLVGSNGSFNQLVVSNGANLFDVNGVLGQAPGSLNNQAWITGAGSLWSNQNSLTVGFFGVSNTVMVSNGAMVANAFTSLAAKTASSNNLVVVTGAGSLWNTANFCTIGSEGPGNALVVSNGGTLVVGTNLSVGVIGSPFSNSVTVSGGNIVVTNPAHSALFTTHFGQVVFESGLIEADRLLMTNSLDTFDFTGGRLITRSGSIAMGEPLILGNGASAPAIWDIRTGLTNHSLSGDLLIGNSSSYNQLLITNGALLSHSGSALLGLQFGSKSNLALLSGAGSRWQMNTDFTLGSTGAVNQLVVSNGAVFVDELVGIGREISSSNNEALVTGAGSLWSNISVVVGIAGSANRLTVSNGATVFANFITLGSLSSSVDNRVVVDGGILRVTNVANSGVLDVRRGTNIINLGLIEVDRLLVTNTLGAFELNGGVLKTENTTNNNGRVFFVGNGTDEASINLLGNSTHHFANGLTVRSNTVLAGNGTIIGTVTVQSGAQMFPGTFVGDIGKLILNNSPVLQGVTLMIISRNGVTLTNDQIQVAAPLTYDGRLIVSKIGPTALAAGDRFVLFNAPGYSGSFSPITLPGLAAGLTWTNKLLLDGSIQVVSAAAPKFGSVTLAGTNVIFSGSGGLSGATYTVLASTNAALALPNWTSILTNQFDASGNFVFTNAIAPAVPRRFYIIQTP